MLNKPRWVVLAWVLATLTIASGMLQLTSLNKYEGDLPTTDPLVADRARFEAAFGDGQTMLVAVESTDLMSSRSIQRLREISAGLSRIPGVPEDGVIGLATLTSGPAAGRLIDVIEALSTEDLRASAIASRPELARFVSSDGNTTLIAVTVSRRASQSAVASAVASVVMTFSGPERIYVIGTIASLRRSTKVSKLT